MSAPDDLSDLSLFSPETLAEPWEAYRRLRDHTAVYSVPGAGLEVVTRYDLVVEALADPDTYSSRFGAFLASAAMATPEGEPGRAVAEARRGMLPPVDTLITADPPEHTRYRTIVKRVFTAGRVRRMEPYADRIIAETIEEWIEREEPVDFVQAFALPVPLRVIADRLGVPSEDRPFFYDGATAAATFLRLTVPPPDQQLRQARLGVELQDYMVALVESRRAEPREDMATTLAQAELEDEGRPLNRSEIWSILNQFLVAGHETTASAFGAGMRILCEQPELQERVQGSPERIRAFCEEALRLEAPVQGLPRLVTRDTELGGHPLVKGDLLMLRFGAANRDERQFPRPDEVDLERRNPGAHLAFGSGTHHCPGAPLSRMELNRGFLALLDRMKDFRLAPGRPAPKAEPSMLLRSLPELWIEFDRR